MGARKKVTKFSAQLPPTPCLPALREQVVSFSQRMDRSIADIQRSALLFFLSVFDSKLSINDNRLSEAEITSIDDSSAA